MPPFKMSKLQALQVAADVANEALKQEKLLHMKAELESQTNELARKQSEFVAAQERALALSLQIKLLENNIV